LKVTIKLWAMGKRAAIVPAERQIEAAKELPEDLDERIRAAVEVEVHGRKAKERS